MVAIFATLILLEPAVPEHTVQLLWQADSADFPVENYRCNCCCIQARDYQRKLST